MVKSLPLMARYDVLRNCVQPSDETGVLPSMGFSRVEVERKSKISSVFSSYYVTKTVNEGIKF